MAVRRNANGDIVDFNGISALASGTSGNISGCLASGTSSNLAVNGTGF